MPGWVQQASEDYSRRLPAHWQFCIREVPQANLGSAEVNKAKESDTLLAAITDKTHLVALDERGTAWSTKQLATQLENWQGLGKPVALFVGGPDGLATAVLERADQRFSLSKLTFPHPMVRVMLTEQLYRAQSIIDNHPYHRA